MRMDFLTKERGRIFRITRVANVPWILEHGIQCAASTVRDPAFHPIGNPDLIEKRSHRDVPVGEGGTLSDYVPFYFTPRTPMLYKIKTGHGGTKTTPIEEIVVIVSSVPRLAELGVDFVVVDRHAYLLSAGFTSGRDGMDQVDWSVLQAGDFARRDDDPGRIERYQAELLVRGVVPVAAIDGFVCSGEATKESLVREAPAGGLSSNRVAVRPNWLFA